MTTRTTPKDSFVRRLGLAILAMGIGSATLGVSPIAAEAPRCGGRPVTVTGTPGADVINLTGMSGGPHVVASGAGDDRIIGSQRRDLICSGAGNDVIQGGGGNDTVWAGPGNDRVLGGDGDDRIVGGDGDDAIRGGPGADDLRGGPGADRLVGDAGNDRLVGGAGDDKVNGSDGDDDEFTNQPLEIIFDTDMGPDIDDPVALAMLHSYEKRKLIKLSAVTISRNSPLAARYTDAVNTFYGRPNIPIGYYRGQTGYQGVNRYAKLVTDHPGRFPHNVHRTPIPHGYQVMLQALRAAEDNSVVIVQVGFSGNLARLLESREGVDLVERKVKFLSIMAGDNSGGQVEFNIKHDLASAKKLFGSWKGEILQSEWELGYNTFFPGAAIQRMSNDGRHPIKAAYNYRADPDREEFSWHVKAGSTFNMRSWDLTSVLAAVEDPQRYFSMGRRGTITLTADGKTKFAPHENGKHRSLGSSSRANQGAIKARMVALVTDSP